MAIARILLLENEKGFRQKHGDPLLAREPNPLKLDDTTWEVVIDISVPELREVERKEMHGAQARPIPTFLFGETYEVTTAGYF